MSSYLESLTVRLAVAAADLPADMRSRHAEFLLTQQTTDGGFRGREGGSDLYYTSFALRALGILGSLTDDVSQQAADYLKHRLSGRESIVDFFSLIYSAKLVEAASGIDVFQSATADWKEAVAQFLESLRCDDGGFAKGPEGKASSTYHTFLVVLCLQLIEQPIIAPDRIVDFIKSQACDDGGFREIRVSKRAGTNPTAAAIATLKIFDALDESLANSTIDFLAEMQVETGGLRANTRIPIADVLSTFTGVLTLQDLDSLEAIDHVHAFQYLKSLQDDDGGFYGAEWDQARDCEYTFYGVAGMGLLNGRQTLS